MTRQHRLTLAVLAALAATTLAPFAFAQSTDGYHSIQVFPLVVDTGSFAQRFTLRNPDLDNAVTVTPTYVPGDGTSQATPLTCETITIPAGGSVTLPSLHDVCAALPGGSQFGFLHLAESSPANRPFAAFSRVSNPLGNGFTVEAFPAHTFTSADTVIAGIRRVSASGSSPALQTNCFIGNLNEVTPGEVTFPTTVEYSILDATGAEIARASAILTPGHLTRLFDVFAAAGAPAGDYPDATVKFEELGSGEPGLLTYCTVQDNTSYGADFRIGKQEGGYSTAYSSIGAQDDHVTRDAYVAADIAGPTGTARDFSIPAGAFANTHVMYFRHPDSVQCELANPITHERLVADDGLELRMLDQDGALVAGGNMALGFGEVYLGDKGDRNDGANTRYLLEVESNGLNLTNERPYALHCQSGSGHSLGDMVRVNTAGTTF
jgi:hypothetical protein